MSVSPSNLERRILCPGSEREEAKIGYVPGGPAAERGKLLHTLLEGLLSIPKEFELIDPATKSLIGEALARGLNEDDVKAAQWCHDQLGGHIAEAESAKDLILIEHDIDLGEIGMSNHARVDFAIVRPGKWAKIFDAKFGMWPETHPSYNWQMRAYAVGMALNFGVQEVSATILQPALEAPNNVRSAVFNSELGQLYAIIKERAAICHEPGAPLMVSDKGCQWCNAKMVCPARTGAVMGVLPRGTAIKAFYEVSSPAVRTQLYEQLILAQEWVEQAVKESDAFILAGGEIPGFKVGAGKEGRFWMKDEYAAGVLAEVAATKNVPLESLHELISPSKAEKLFGKSKAVLEKLAPLIAKKPGNPTVIRDKGAEK